VLYAALVGNVVRFVYISFLRSPWMVLPFELVQGMNNASLRNTYFIFVCNFFKKYRTDQNMTFIST